MAGGESEGEMGQKGKPKTQQPSCDHEAMNTRTRRSVLKMSGGSSLSAVREPSAQWPVPPDFSSHEENTPLCG